MNGSDAEKGDDSETLNAIGAAAQSIDLNVAEPVSGMPAGGPHDLGKKSHRDSERDDVDI